VAPYGARDDIMRGNAVAAHIGDRRRGAASQHHRGWSFRPSYRRDDDGV